MAQEAGSVEVQVRANLSQLDRGLRQGERATRASGRKMQTAADGVQRSFARVSAASMRANGSLDRYGRATGRVATATAKTTGEIEAATHAYGRMYTRLGGVTLAMRSMFGVTAALGTAFAAFRTLQDFSIAMAQVKAITKSTAVDMSELTGKARDLGATTEFTASQVANAMVFLGRAGLSTNEILSSITDTLNLATAAQVDLGSAANITANILRTFHIPAAQTAKVTDLLAAASAAANTDVLQLGDAMKYVGLGAKSVNVPLNDIGAALGALADAGLIGSQAGTGLRRVLAALVNPTAEAKKAITGLGLTMKQVNPETNKLVDVMERFRRAGLTFAQALQIAGQRGGSVLIGLSDNAPRLRELTAAMQGITGEALRQASVIRDQLGQDWKTLISAVQEFFLAAGAAGATSALRAGLQSITTAVRYLASQMEDLKAVLVGVVAYVGVRLVGALAAARDGFIALTAAMAKNPLGLLAIAVATAITYLYKYRDATFQVGQVTLRVGDFLSAAWTTIAESIKGVLSWVFKLSQALGKLITLDFTGAMKSASDAGYALQKSGQAIFDSWKKAFGGTQPLPGGGFDEAGFAGFLTHAGPAKPPGSQATQSDAAAQKKFAQAIENIKKQTEQLQIQARTMNMATEAAARYEAKQKLLNEAARQHIKLAPQDKANIDKVADAYARATKAVEDNQKAIQRADQARRNLGEMFSGFTKDLAHGASLTDALTSALGRLADKLIDMAVNNLVQQALGPLGSPLGGGGQTFRPSGGLLGGFLIPGILHDGGAVGSAPRGPAVPASAFANAPKFAAGLSARAPGINEVPILAHRGEVVGWPGQMREAFGQGGGVVNVHAMIDLTGANGDNTIKQISGQAAVAAVREGISQFSTKQLPVRLQEIQLRGG